MYSECMVCSSTFSTFTGWKVPVVAVGTTSVRSLESASTSGTIEAFQGESTIFIYPGYEFRSVDALITNFHLPESTLIMLVSAFAGQTQTLSAYDHAVQNAYRFYSYGDAMFIPRSLKAVTDGQEPEL